MDLGCILIRTTTTKKAFGGVVGVAVKQSGDILSHSIKRRVFLIMCDTTASATKYTTKSTGTEYREVRYIRPHIENGWCFIILNVQSELRREICKRIRKLLG